MKNYLLSPRVEIIEDSGSSYVIHHNTGFVLELSSELLEFLKFIQEQRNSKEVITFITEQSSNEEDPQKILEYITQLLESYSLI